MISGKAKRLGLTLAALLPLQQTAWCAAPDLNTLLQQLARPAPAGTPFVEIRFSSLLATPLRVSGRLEYNGPQALARTVEEPFRERTEIRGETVIVERDGTKPRRFSLKRAPELKGLLGSFAALLGGDRAALEEQFEIRVDGADQSWKLSLTPRDARVRRRISEITITGQSGEPRCLVTAEADGDATFMLMAEAAGASLPQPLDRARLEELCNGSRG